MMKYRGSSTMIPQRLTEAILILDVSDQHFCEIDVGSAFFTDHCIKEKQIKWKKNMSTFNWGTEGKEVVKEYGKNAEGKTSMHFVDRYSTERSDWLTFIVLITGASENGLGAVTAVILAHAKPAHLILTARNLSKVQPVLDEICSIDQNVKTTFISIDLSSIEATRIGAAKIDALVEKIDILINNAGVMAIKEYTKSVDGLEMQLATNHVGHFLLTNLLMGKILKAGQGTRIVNLSSLGHRASPFRFEDYNFSVSIP